MCPHTCKKKLGSCRFHIPLTPRDLSPKDKDTRLLRAPPLTGPPPKCGKEASLCIFSRVQFQLFMATTLSFSYYFKPLGAAVFGDAGRDGWRVALPWPQEILDIRASISCYPTTARHHEDYAWQSTLPRVPWKLFQNNHQHSAGTDTLLYGSVVFTSCLESFWEVRGIYIITK